MTPGTLVIRADASAQIGWGHVMRCLALAQAWQDRGGDCIFAMTEAVEAVNARLISENIQVVTLSATPGSADDAEQLSEIARKCDSRWIVVDGYNFGEEYPRRLKEAGHRLLAIDDYGHGGTCLADLVLDQNAGTDEHFYPSRSPNLLLGTRYALLRREFKPWRNWKREIPPAVRKILVTMGGSDPENLTEHVIRALELVTVEGLEATILVGAANPRISRLQDVVSHSKRRIRIETGCGNVSELMAWADLAISASGSTCWEMCAVGLPAVVIDAAENQMPIARELHAREVAIHIRRSDANPKKITETINQLVADSDCRTRMSSRARELVDGYGAERVVALLRTRAFTLRPVEQNDCRLLWEWTNDPVVRAASFSSNEIRWEEHTEWFERVLCDESAVLLMFEERGTPVATIRTRATTVADAEISITLAPEFRGQGLASGVLDRALEHAFASTELERIHAFIRPDNAASSRSFGNAGFKLHGNAQIKNCDALHYVCERERQINVSLPYPDHTQEATTC